MRERGRKTQFASFICAVLGCFLYLPCRRTEPAASGHAGAVLFLGAIPPHRRQVTLTHYLPATFTASSSETTGGREGCQLRNKCDSRENFSQKHFVSNAICLSSSASSSDGLLVTFPLWAAVNSWSCLLYTSDAADDYLEV